MFRELTQVVKASKKDFTYLQSKERCSPNHERCKEEWWNLWKENCEAFWVKLSSSHIDCQIKRNFIDTCPVRSIFRENSYKLVLACWLYCCLSHMFFVYLFTSYSLNLDSIVFIKFNQILIRMKIPWQCGLRKLTNNGFMWTKNTHSSRPLGW